MTERTHQVRRGRVAEAERNDASILTAARSVFIFDAKSPVSEVAKRAGVGIGALYSRYGSKENLLATLCELGQQTYLTEVERALASDEDPGEAYFGFLRRIVVADTHSLTVHLAGTLPKRNACVNSGTISSTVRSGPVPCGPTSPTSMWPSCSR